MTVTKTLTRPAAAWGYCTVICVYVAARRLTPFRRTARALSVTLDVSFACSRVQRLAYIHTHTHTHTGIHTQPHAPWWIDGDTTVKCYLFKIGKMYAPVGV